MARTPVALHVVRLASRLPSTDGTRFDHKTDATRAKPHAPPFSAHPVFGPSRGVGRPVRPATARRDDTGDTQARIRRMRLFASVRARLQRDRRSSPRASRASPRGSFKLTLVTGAFRSRSNASRRDSVAGEKKARARARRSETRAGTSSRKRASSATPRVRARAGLATLARLAPATWRASRRAERTLTRTNDERIWNAGTRAPKTSVPRSLQVLSKGKKNPSARPVFSDRRSSSRQRISRLRAARPCRAAQAPRGRRGSRSAGREVGVVFLRASSASGPSQKGARLVSVRCVGAYGLRPRVALEQVDLDGKRSDKTLRNRDPQPQNRRRLYRRASLPKRERFVRRRVMSSGRVTFPVQDASRSTRAAEAILLTKTKKKVLTLEIVLVRQVATAG